VDRDKNVVELKVNKFARVDKVLKILFNFLTLPSQAFEGVFCRTKRTLMLGRFHTYKIHGQDSILNFLSPICLISVTITLKILIFLRPNVINEAGSLKG